MKKFSYIFLAVILSYSVGQSQQDSIKMFIFGHSLLDHRPPAIPTPSDETTVPHWLYLMANHASKYCASGGQYGFLPQHQNVPPFSQWGYDIVPPVWDSDNESFAEADFNYAMITAGNFMQWQSPNEEYPSDPGISPISATETIVDWLIAQEDTIKIYIYENWPDMAPYLQNGFPPSASEFSNYNNYTLNGFHDWWIEYHDSLLLSRPTINVRMIPVGPILSEMLIDTVLNQVPLTELYEDDAPHGRASIYFLASLISYMAIFEMPAPLDYPVPSIIHTIIQNNYEAIVNQIWTKLQDFNTPTGESRVFYDALSSNPDITLEVDGISIVPNPVENYFQIKGITSDFNMDIIDVNGNVFMNINTMNPSLLVDVSSLPSGMYFIRIQNINSGQLSVEKIIKFN